LTDQGPDFMSKLFTEMCKLLEIEKLCCTPYQPRANGLVERANKTIQSMLKAFVNEIRDDWDDYLPYVQFAFLSTVQSSTGYSPSQLFLGRSPMGPLDLLLGRNPNPENNSNCYVAYVEWVKEAMTKSFEFARDKMRASVEYQTQYYNVKSKEINFEPGNWVWYYNVPQSKAKLGKGWEGPYLILRKLSDVTYEIQRSSGSRTKIVNVDKLKSYIDTDDLPVKWVSFDKAKDVSTQVSLDPSPVIQVSMKELKAARVELEKIDMPSCSRSRSRSRGEGKRRIKAPDRFSPSRC